MNFYDKRNMQWGINPQVNATPTTIPTNAKPPWNIQNLNCISYLDIPTIIDCNPKPSNDFKKTSRMPRSLPFCFLKTAPHRVSFIT